MTTTVSVENIGPIARGSVELKPLTIFVGPGNTGKSYMATAIYALAQGFEHITGEVDLPVGRVEDMRLFPINRWFFPAEKISEDVGRAVKEWAGKVEVGARKSVNVRLDSLPGPAINAIGEYASQRLAQASEFFAAELHAAYGGTEDGRKRGADAGVVNLSQPYLTMKHGLDSLGIVSSHNLELPLETAEDIPAWFIHEVRSAPPHVESLYDDLIRLFAQRALLKLAGYPLDTRAYYLPASRSGIAQGHKAIAGALVRRSPIDGLNSAENPRLPSVVTDFISRMLAMERSRAESLPPKLKETVHFMESQIIRGSVDFARDADLPYPEIQYAPGGDVGYFPINKASSMVSELAPVVLFLKYLVREGDLVILEEPESHLHPAAQRQMARGIVRLVNAGVKVLITTHSEFLVSQINNLMRLSHAAARTVKKYGYQPADCLKQADAAAYLFRWDSELGGSVVEELEIRADVGIDEDEFAHVAAELYDETVSFQRIRIK